MEVPMKRKMTKEQMRAKCYRVIWRRLSTEHGDASWCCHGDLVRMVTPYGHKATQLGGSPAEHIARLLMRELAGQHKLKSKGF
jgi:hypothetical protein